MDLNDNNDVVTDRRLPGWRARLIVDDHAGEPWGDALAPALIISSSGHVQAAADVYQDRRAEQIRRAWQHFTDHDLFSRYLRLSHGTTAIAAATTGDTTVLTFDTSDYRAHAGITTITDLTGERDEWQAWLDGDVYGVIVEHRTTAQRCLHCGHIRPSSLVEVDACWGHYGRAYAAEQALHLLRAAARS
ncbi:hypothetical protein GCM10010399_83980 [Dactylosporangium fulvum]|uniref:Uncharacterized protein n=1 Tax=Dactylosporangium fulvum TaxID=53359 RepID=A0ABY5VSJ1_9ACTN|nr:hypothetical protein [Dactylosporangium fulvum]UWP80530.1 hypothetical protein Dfulv_35975 [Dactylosporangium fulvum]